MGADWTERFVNLSKHIKSWSKDRSTQVAAVIVNDDNRIVSIGYNGFPNGCNDNIESRHERPAKYMYTEHAERNAIYNAARIGVSTKNCTIYLDWFPCVDCARAIIQSGITHVVCGKPDAPSPRWIKNFAVSLELFQETDVKVTYYEKEEESI